MGVVKETFNFKGREFQVKNRNLVFFVALFTFSNKTDWQMVGGGQIFI